MNTSDLENGDSREYWAGAREGKLRFQRCDQCDATQFPPRYHCATCWSDTLSWVDVSGRGHVESFTTVRRAPLNSFREKVPYVIGAIVTAEGPRMITNIVGSDALDVQIGDEVEVDFTSDDAGNILPQFRRISTAA